MVERRPGVWQLRAYCGKNEHGRKAYAYRTFKGSTTKAERELRRFQTEVEQMHPHGIVQSKTVITFDDVLDRWVESHAEKKAQTTKDRYLQIVRDYVRPALGHYDLNTLKLEHVQRLYDRLDREYKLSSLSVKHTHSVIRNACNFARRMGWMERNPTENAVLAKGSDQEMNILSQEQVGKLVTYCLSHPVSDKDYITQWRIPVLIAIWTGMRRGEICGLTFDCVDAERRTIEVRQSVTMTTAGFEFKEPKTRGSRRTLHVSQKLINVLMDHKQQVECDKQMHPGCYHDHGLVCCRPDGQPIYPDNLTRAFKTMLKRAELPEIRFHDLRHTHASILLKELPVHTVSRRLGHSSARVTLDVYGHLLPGMSEEVVDVFDQAIGQGENSAENNADETEK